MCPCIMNFTVFKILPELVTSEMPVCYPVYQRLSLAKNFHFSEDAVKDAAQANWNEEES